MAESTSGDRLKLDGLLAQGTILGDRFVVKRFLAQGGMGRVYVAEQQPMGRKVALKVMRSDLAADDRAVKRFFREAVAISKLRHPNTITLFDYGKSDDGSLYIAMEFLDGLSLKEVLADQGSLPVTRVARIAAQIGLSLAEAHRKGVIHRDLKPDNVFLSEVEGQPDFVKVIDFGIAQLLTHDGESRITQLGYVCGTPEYMSPEQARGDELDGRSDLYSLGVMLYEMLEGRLPFQGDTPLAIVLKHQTAAAPELGPQHPEPLRLLVRDLLAKTAALRPARAEDVLARLKEAAPGEVSLGGLELRPMRGQTLRAAAARDVAAGGLGAMDTGELAETLADLPSNPSQEATPAALLPSPSAPILVRRRRGALIGVGVLVMIALAAVLLALDNSGLPAVAGDRDTPPPSVPLRNPPAQPTPSAEATAQPEPPPSVATAEPEPPPTQAPIRATVRTEPPGAMVHLDNRYLGLSPVPIALEPGQNAELLLRLDGYEDLRQPLALAANQDGAELGPFALVPATTRLVLTSDPPGAEVFELASGESWGLTEGERQVRRGLTPIELEFRLAGHEPARIAVTPSQPEVPVAVELRRIRRRTTEEQAAPEPAEQQTGGSPFGSTVD